MKTLILFPLWMVLMASGPAAASSLTLDEALEVALAEHPDLLAAQAEIQASRAEADAAGAWSNPRLFLRMEAAPREGDSWQGSERIYGFSQDLGLFGLAGALAEAGHARTRLAEADARVQVSELKARVRLAYCRTWRADQSLEMSRQTRANAEKISAIMLLRQQEGDASRVDVHRARTAAAGARIAESRAVVEYQTALSALQSWLGRELPDGVRLLAPPALRHEFDERSPALATAEARAEVSRQEIRVASRSRLPELEVEAGLRTAPDADSFDLGLKMELPLFNRGGQALQAARARHRADQHHRESLRRELKTRQEEAYRWIESTERALAEFDEEILPLTEEILEATRQAFEIGEVELTEVLLVTEEWLTARRDRLQLLAERHQAEATLVRLR